jgi:hypothetical protein
MGEGGVLDMKASEALSQMGHDLEFDISILTCYYEEDNVGGYPETWPVGSIWDSEGRLLYAIVRYLQPEVVVEFGTRYGCSTAHILKAMDRNDSGMLWTVDNGANGLMDVNEHPRLIQTVMDGIEYAKAWDGQVDMIFEDGPHSTEFTREVISAMLPHLREGGIVTVHDVEHYIVGEDVSLGFREAVAGSFGHVRIDPSDCGLGYWRKS